jgi:hypothetical protein
MTVAQRTCSTDRLNVYRLFARTFVLGGGVFWVLVVFTGTMGMNSEAIFLFTSASSEKFGMALAYAMIWVVVAAVVFVVGLFWERIAAILLGVAAVGSIAYGVALQWETGLWFIVGLFIILPIAIAATFYLLAAREQALCDSQGVDTRSKPPATSAA